MNNKLKNSANLKLTTVPQTKDLKESFLSAFTLVDDIVLKNYVTRLSDFSVIPLEKTSIINNLSKIRLFKINEMVYKQDESSAYKFASVFNAVSATKSSIITIINSDGVKTDFYLGIRSTSEDKSTRTSYSTLVNAVKGQFPGTSIENLKNNRIEGLISSINSNSISSVSCIANNKNKEFIGNDEYLQGLEKLALAMQGNKYTAIILANSTSQEQLNSVRQNYETIYTQLSPYANTVVSYGTNNMSSETDTKSSGETESESDGRNEMFTENKSVTKNTGTVASLSQQTAASKAGSGIGASLSIVGAAIGSIMPGVGNIIGAGLGSAVGGMVGAAVSTATNKSTTSTSGGGSESIGATEASGTSNTKTRGSSYNISNSLGFSVGETQNMQLKIQNKPIINMLERIDKQLERISEFESIGMWECATYFLSGDPSVSEVAASTYKSLMSGENSGVEVSAINTWNKPQELTSQGVSQNEFISEYIKNFIHPVFDYKVNGFNIPIMPTSLISGNELAIHMGLPRNSVCGFPVIKHADFGKEIVKYDKEDSLEKLSLGSIFNMGRVVEGSNVSLDIESLSMHTLIVGATGSGKSNTIYKILEELSFMRKDTFNFLVIEPTKGEYKRIFGNKKGVHVFGTNPNFTELLKINPFKFPDGIHVLEHVDRLIEIFNVCWPMYAAMPAILKEAILSSYKSCGWDMTTSVNVISKTLYPTFQDLLDQLVKVIDNSSYSEEVKSNYKGSLITRIRSLTNGLNGQLFASDEICNSILFDSKVIVDLSRIASQETKSLLMGILVMRLSEHRMTNNIVSNQKLHHITVLEEAHNILTSSKNLKTEDGGDIASKSVEMISNAIAEMRTYGEGFIIADQSSNAIDISAIRNTNTKIIMRLPEESDRRISGKSAAMKDSQLDEIARLPKGVAVIYQNDWIEPVLCKIDKCKYEEKEYYISSGIFDKNSDDIKAATVLINFIIKNRLENPKPITVKEVSWAIGKSKCTARTKTLMYSILEEYKLSKKNILWNSESFSKQAFLVKDVLELASAVENTRQMFIDFTGFNCHLNSLISKKIENASEDLILNINHCLMKAYSETEADGITYYQSWYDNIAKRGGYK